MLKLDRLLLFVACFQLGLSQISYSDAKVVKCVETATITCIVLSTNFVIFKFIVWRMSTRSCKLIKPKYQTVFLMLIVEYISVVKKYCLCWSTKFVKLVYFMASLSHIQNEFNC